MTKALGQVSKKTEKFTNSNEVLLVLGWRTGAHREDCIDIQ